MERYMKRGGSGLSLAVREEPYDAFVRFIAGSKLTGSPTRGGIGFIFRYHNPTDIYRSSDIDNFGAPIHTILVKFIPIEDFRDSLDFDSEVKIQNDIYKITNDNREPLCPAIVFSKMCDKTDSILNDLKFFEHIQKFSEEDEDYTIPNVEKVGIIAMEFLDDYEEMYEILPNKLEFIVPVFMAAAFLLIELGDKTGYTQGDFTFRNIFFRILPEEPENPYFLTDGIFDSLPPELESLKLIRRIKPILIDFGYAKKIDSMAEFRRFYSLFQFLQILGLICSEGSKRKRYHILSQPDFFGWASGSQVVIDSILQVPIYMDNLLNNNLTFFKNAEGPFTSAVLSEDQRLLLNTHFNGEDGIMQKIITARENSKVKMLEFIQSHPIVPIYQSHNKILEDSEREFEPEKSTNPDSGYIPRKVEDVILLAGRGGKRTFRRRKKTKRKYRR